MRRNKWMTLPFTRNLSGLGLATIIRGWMSKLDYKTAYYDHTVDPALHDLSRRRFIYVFWHEYILYQLYLRGNCDICMLLSQNRDAEVLSRVAYHMGFDTVRGSTYGGARRAVRQLLRVAPRMHLTITPDGPRGPRRRMSPGPLYLASKLQMPLIALGMGYDRPWRLNSWDRFAVPRPNSRARCLVSPPIVIPPDLQSHQLEDCRGRVERILNLLTSEAESWAAGGYVRHPQWPTRRQAKQVPRRGHARVSLRRKCAIERPCRAA